MAEEYSVTREDLNVLIREWRKTANRILRYSLNTNKNIAPTVVVEQVTVALQLDRCADDLWARVMWRQQLMERVKPASK